MRYLIASDLHGSYYYAQKLWEAYDREGADKMLFLGDLLYHGPRNDLPRDYDPKAVIALMNSRKEEILCVRGNCEADVDQMVLEFPVMADYAILTQRDHHGKEHMIFATHGHVFNENHVPMLKDGDVLLHGHTHVAVCREHETYVYMNPGSLSIPKEDTAHGYMMMEDGTFTWKELETGEIIREYRLGDRLVLINQAGYRPTDIKIVILRDASLSETFEIIDVRTKESVYQGKFTEILSGGSSEEKTGKGEFTGLTSCGTYLIRTEKAGDSYPFTIAEDAYDALLADSILMLTLQRCGMELSTDLAGEYAHPACHTEAATIYGTDEEIDVSGGWHDAGDYGRYVVPAAKTVADMMLAYEAYPEVFDALDVPEEYSILAEARYELEWMLKMQNAEGGVYHKVTGLHFDGMIMPEECTEKLYVLPVSVAATGDFAASMYMASRVYRDIDAAFADTCMAAAEKAFAYFEEHKEEKGFVNPPDCFTGEYGDEDMRDEYFWAAAERYKTTRDPKMPELIASMPVEELDAGGLGWSDMTCYGLYAYLTTEGAPENPVIRNAFFAYADKIVKILVKDSYHSSIPGHYPWGSNMTIANNGVILLMAAELSEDGKTYAEAARTQLDYLLGINTSGYCFVSGYGMLSMEHPHHRPSLARGKAMKGMLSGGPNDGLQDPCAKKNLQGRSIADCYIDHGDSYSTNEITIYWNSPFIYLLAGLCQI